MTGQNGEDAAVDPLYASAERTVGFVWEHLVSIVAISVAWFFAALPVVTVGPATVGVYAAVLSLRADDASRIDREAVLKTVREQFVHAALIGLVPLVLLGIAAGYGLAYLSGGGLGAGLLAVAAWNAGCYAWLVSVPTLIGLAGGEPVVDALAGGVAWTTDHAVASVVLGVVTAVLLIVTSLLTVAAALLFAGVAFAFHVQFVTDLTDRDPIATATPTQ